MISKEKYDDRIYNMHAEMCKMLSHPTRLRILEQLKEKERTVSEIVETLDMNQSTVSQHLSELKKSGLVKAERDGANMRYDLVYPKIIDACEIVREILFEELSRDQDLLKMGKGDKDGEK